MTAGNGAAAAERSRKGLTATDVVQFLASAAGLGVYLVLLGGAVHWAQLASADLPPDSALPTADPRELVAIGIRSLLRGPAAVLILFLLVLALPSVARMLRHNQRVAGVLRWIGRAVLGLMVFVVVFYVGLVAAVAYLFTGVRLAIWLEGDETRVLWRVLGGVCAGVVAAGVVLLRRAIRRRRERKLREGGGDPQTEPAREAAAEPGLPFDLWPFTAAEWLVAQLRRRRLVRAPRHPALRALAAVAAAVIAFELAVLWFVFDSTAVEDVVAWIVVALATIAVARLVHRSHAWWAGLADALEWTASRDRRDVKWGQFIVVAAFGLLLVFVFPLWAAAAIGSFLIVVWFIDSRAKDDDASGDERPVFDLPPDWKLRALLLSVVVTVTAVCWEASPPITFDRAEVHAGGNTASVAYLGVKGSETWFAMCDRDGRHSHDSRAVGIQSGDIDALVLASGGYTFYPNDVPTLASVTLSLFGVSDASIGFDPVRPTLETSLFSSTPPEERLVSGLCGDGRAPDVDDFG